jgi:hypothetical protein
MMPLTPTQRRVLASLDRAEPERCGGTGNRVN